jgi:hypothetical protein
VCGIDKLNAEFDYELSPDTKKYVVVESESSQLID